MGYTTEFRGSFSLNKTLAENHFAYLNKFAITRRMKRNPEIASGYLDPVREAVNLPIGNYAEYFTGPSGFRGQDRDESIIEYNSPPPSQPGLWCQWVPSDTGDSIEWDGGEKFYEYVPWIEYLITNFLKPWGYVLNGTVAWRGEEWEDTGKIVIVDNKISVET